MKPNVLRNLIILLLCGLVIYLLIRTESNTSADNQYSMQQDACQDDSLSEVVATMEKQLAGLHLIYDSVAIALENEIQANESQMPTDLSAGQVELQQLARDLNQGLSQLSTTNDPDTFLKYFHEEFTTNRVIFDLDNIVNVKRESSQDSRAYIKSIAENDQLQVTAGPIRPIRSYARGDAGVIVFFDKIRSREGSEVNEGTILVTLVCKRYDGNWKIGNMSTVNIQEMHDEIWNRL